MTRVDFYILSSESHERRLEFACQLAEKALAQTRRVLIAVEDENQAQQLSDLLWCHKPESFLPHGRIGEESNQGGQALDISARDECLDHHDVLISIRRDIPAYFSRFQRFAEIVVQEPQILANTRNHWNFFKERGYPVNHHPLRG